MKRRVTKSKFDFLQHELSHFERQGVISSEQAQSMLSMYEVKAHFSFIRVLLVVGSLLVGAGILSFIAGNWNLLPKPVKFLMILIGLIGFYWTGWKTEKSYPKTSKSMYYVGLFIYGAGIFLIGQMFHLDSDYQNAFLAWALGAVLLALYLKDKWVSLLSIILMGIYASGSWSSDVPYPFALFIFIPLMYWMNEAKINQSKVVFFFNNLLMVFWLVITMIRLDVDERLIPLVILGIGIIIMFLPDRQYAKVLEWQGSILHGICAIILTFSHYWSLWAEVFHFEAIGFILAIAYIGFIFYLLKKGSLPAIIITCSFIFRFYVDISYDFLPKSLFFIIGGGLLLGFGYWFEKKRRGGDQAV